MGPEWAGRAIVEESETKSIGTVASSGPIIPDSDDECVWNIRTRKVGTERD
jgi:hypothetical protein